jgi:carbonic anhydrase
MSGTDDLVRNAERYARAFSASTTGRLRGGPVRRVAVVACMDARMDVFRILGLKENDAHVIRNAGGIVTDDVLRSVVLSQRLLGTEEVMLVHHTDCGMTKFQDDELATEIAAEVGSRPPFALGAFADPETDVRRSMALIAASPYLPHKHVRGFVYEVETGVLREVQAR